MKNILTTIDKLLCGYLGLKESETIPHFVVQKGQQLIILKTESFKRHIQNDSIKNITLNNMNKENKEKLGAAIGKSIAKNLVISFEEVIIIREKFHA